MTDVATAASGLEQFRTPEGGFLLVDKPRDWTSFDVVKKVRGLLKVRKIGHAGTLDPLATGLLILASGQCTRRIDAFQTLPKEYTGTMTLGAVTASFDAATPEERHAPFAHLRPEDIARAAAAFLGPGEQIPPMFSAVKVGGRRLYALARKGLDIERAPRPVEIFAFDLLSVTLPLAEFRIACSKGTYVRSLVHDLGQTLGCGAYLQSLRRTNIGSFAVEDAWTLEGLAAAAGTVRYESRTEPRSAGAAAS